MSDNFIPSNHMEIYWHDYAGSEGKMPIVEASLTEKASIIGRTGLMLLSSWNRCVACQKFYESR